MTTRTKEEQQLLDEKIARIQKKNEEILRRRQEVEEDKRLAEQQNAVVKLRPSSTTTDRERTPALKPSKRELREELVDDNFEPHVERRPRGGFRGRGVERYRGQGDWKTTGPPPDPRSFLYDDERDAPPRDKDEKGDFRRDSNMRRRGNDRDNTRDENRRGREFERGGCRGNYEYGMERGRRGGRGGNMRSQEEAWKEERMKIDEARIQRQKSSDGKWRREWDNEKIFQEPEEPRYELRHSNTVIDEPRRSANHYHCPMHRPTEDFPRQMYKETPTRRGRGRGRLHPSELEMPLDEFPLEILKKPNSPSTKSDVELGFGEDPQILEKTIDLPLASPKHLNYKLDSERKIECVGDSVKISISNSVSAQSTFKPQRQTSENRARLRSQPSCSSQSDEDSPRERGSRSGRRPRTHKYQRGHGKKRIESETYDNFSINSSRALSSENKPPLPPSQADKKIPSSNEVKEEGDESWEDVTTSGNESFGEDLMAVKLPLIKKVVIDKELTEDQSENTLKAEPSDYPFDQYLQKVGISPQVCSTNGANNVNFFAKEETVVHNENPESTQENISSDCISLDVTDPDIGLESESFSDVNEKFRTHEASYDSPNKHDSAENEQDVELKVPPTTIIPEDIVPIKIIEETEQKVSDLSCTSASKDLSTDNVSLEKVEETKQTEIPNIEESVIIAAEISETISQPLLFDNEKGLESKPELGISSE